MDPLSVTASVVGLLAAAAKVCSLLEQLSSASSALSTIQDAQTEVKHAALSLQLIQTVLQRLDTVNPQRSRLIQIDELRVTLADAMLTFSEFESLLQLLMGMAKMRVSITWVRYAKKIDEHLAKIQRYKVSLTLMLGILHCESDLEASQSQARLQAMMEEVLADNKRLRRLLVSSDDVFDARSTFTRRFGDTTTMAHAQNNDDDDDNDAMTIRDINISRRNTIRSTMSTFAVQAFAFESVLQASWVYRRNERNECDASFASSVPRSHVWSVFSGYSLADISILSVIAMPLTLREITNGQHYEMEFWGQDDSNGIRTNDPASKPQKSLQIQDQTVAKLEYSREREGYLQPMSKENALPSNEESVMERTRKERLQDCISDGQSSSSSIMDHGAQDHDFELLSAHSHSSLDLSEDDSMSEDTDIASISSGDIDTSLLNARHTFEATVERQVSVTKGDTMVLVDDDHEYWWLVRVVKSDTVGYLPAEYVETPVEKLARRNKCRNMRREEYTQPLGDIATRRPWGKTVRFKLTPTYIDCKYSDASSQDEDEQDSEHEPNDQEPDLESSQEEPKSRSFPEVNMGEGGEAPVLSGPRVEELEMRTQLSREASEVSNSSPEMHQSSSMVGHNRARSLDTTLFQDDVMGTRKLNLTPTWLRDDTAVTVSVISAGPRRQRSSDWLARGGKMKGPVKVRSLLSWKRQEEVGKQQT